MTSADELSCAGTCYTQVVDLLRSRNGRLHEHAAVILRNLAINAENEKVIAEEGAVR